MRPVISLALAVMSVSTAASAQPQTPLGSAFLTGATACVSILAGKLSLNPPSPAQAAAGLVLADPTAPDELKPFADLSPRARLFASVEAANGAVVVAQDSSRKLCRVAVLHVKDVSPVTASVGPLAGDWKVVSDDPVANFAVYKGTVLGSSPLTIRIRQPPNDAYGAATYMLTLIAP